jgi:hypothetical protein
MRLMSSDLFISFVLDLEAIWVALPEHGFRVLSHITSFMSNINTLYGLTHVTSDN